MAERKRHRERGVELEDDDIRSTCADKIIRKPQADTDRAEFPTNTDASAKTV